MISRWIVEPMQEAIKVMEAVEGFGTEFVEVRSR